MAMRNSNEHAVTSPHKWRFFRSGGFDQVSLETAADFAALAQLDQKLWAALSCPVQGLEFDSRTLQLLDIQQDNRIRAPEIIAAVQWMCAVLKNPEDLKKGASELPLAAINDVTVEGKQMLAAAQHVLRGLNKNDATAISIEDTRDISHIFANTQFNGDGIVPPSATDDASLRQVMTDVVDCGGGHMDRSGAPGVSQASLNNFYQALADYSAWYAEGEQQSAALLPLGAVTNDAADAWRAVRLKVDDYFTRCRLASFDARAAAHLNRDEKEYEQLATKQFSATAQEVADFPLAQVAANKPLPLTDKVNPAWHDAVAKLRVYAVQPFFGERETLTAEEWSALGNAFAAHEVWYDRKAGASVERLGIRRVRELLRGEHKSAIEELIQRDQALAGEANGVASVERLVRYYRDLYTLLNNFVSLRDFYTRRNKAIFQAGTLYIDGRACELCVRVDDMAKHGALASLSGTYLLYCQCARHDTKETMTIVAAVTGGDSDNLMLGRNGVFYDRKGVDWDATVIKIIEHPISIRQAFWAPYKRVARMVTEQLEKFAASRDKAVTDQAATGIATTAQKVEAGKAPAAPFDVGKFAGIFAAIGLAIGAIGTALASVVTGVMGLKFWQLPLAFGGLILAISGPSMLMAALKLRERNLAPILDASGWAVNTRAKINLLFGSALTSVARLPEGSVRAVDDPFAEKRTPWKTYTFLVLLLFAVAGLWQQGFIKKWYGQYWAQRGHVVVPQTVPGTNPPGQ